MSNQENLDAMRREIERIQTETTLLIAKRNLRDQRNAHWYLLIALATFAISMVLIYALLRR